MSVESNISKALGLGASATTDADYGQQGALRDILAVTSGSAANADRAIALANQLVPDAPEPDPWAAAFQFFSEMGKQASKPGATVLGSAVSSMSVPFDYLQAKKAERNQTEQARLKTALSLGPSLKGPAAKGRGTPVKVVKDDGTIGLAYPDDVIKDNLKIYVAGNADNTKRMDVVVKGAVDDLTTPNIDERIATILESNFDSSKHVSTSSYTPTPAASTKRMDVVVKDSVDDITTPNIDERIATILESDFDSSKHISMSSYTPTKVNTTIEALETRAEAGGLVKDSAEYNAFILNGGKVDTGSPSVEALKERAELAGLTKDSEAYKEFMITGGKTPTGFSFEQDADGTIRMVQGSGADVRKSKVKPGYIEVVLPGATGPVQQVIRGSEAAKDVEEDRGGLISKLALANNLLGRIEAIIGRPEGNGFTAIPQNPDLEAVLGSVQGKIPMNMFFDQGKTDVLVDIDYIKSNAFMQAFESLKGGGQITEKEGEAATAALAKLSRLQDPEKFKAGLQDFVNIIRIGMANNRNLIDELPKYADTITGGEGVELDFNSMDRQRLGLIDIDSLTYLQKQLMAIRLGEL